MPEAPAAHRQQFARRGWNDAKSMFLSLAYREHHRIEVSWEGWPSASLPKHQANPMVTETKLKETKTGYTNGNGAIGNGAVGNGAVSNDAGNGGNGVGNGL